MRPLAVAGVCALLFSSASIAHATTINFDDVIGGATIDTPTNVDTHYVAEGVTFSDSSGPDGVIPGSVAGYMGFSPPNVFFANQHQSSNAGDLAIDFSSAQTGIQLSAFLSSDYYLSYTVESASGAPIYSGASPATSSYGVDTSVSISSLVPFTSVLLTSHPDDDSTYFGNFGIDNLTFKSEQVSAAPEPSTWALMIVGIASLGLALRAGKANSPRRPQALTLA